MENVEQYAIQCFKDEADAILDLIPNLTDDFSKASHLIYNSKGRCIVTGVGKSGHIGAKIAATLASTGTPSFFVNPLDAYHGDLGMFTSDDVVIAISNSGTTDELLRFVPLLLERNIPIIALTGNPKSLLAQYSSAHLNVWVKKEAEPLNLAPTSSTTATLAMGDALAIALMHLRNFKAEDFARYHPGGSLGRRLLTKARDVMRTNDMPIMSPDIHLGSAIIEVSKKKLGIGIAIVNDKIVGVITDGDIRRAMEKYQKEFFDRTVGDIMTKTPKIIPPDMRITQIQEVMNLYKVHSLLVADEDRHLLGVVDHYSCFMG